MKFAFSFLILSTLLVMIANPVQAGWKWVFFWPAANLFVASLYYFANSPACFGKRKNGTLKILNLLFFLPYVVALWCVWFLFARLAKENAFDQVNENLWLGRRLDEKEAGQTEFQNIVDLTAEFIEPSSFRQQNYIPFFMLDGAVPNMDELEQLADQVCQLAGTTYIHCAQGHGRTGLVAVAILLKNDSNLSVDDAVSQLKSCRPGVHCNKRQMKFLYEFAKRYRQDR